MTATVRSRAALRLDRFRFGARVSAYQLQQYMYDQMRDASVDLSTYELDACELAAVSDNDIATLYELGVHPVLLNGWCRALGFTRDTYRELLAPLAIAGERVPRWRIS